MNTNTNNNTFEAEVYFMPVNFEVSNDEFSFSKRDAARASQLGIKGYTTNGTPIAEVVIWTPGNQDDSWSDAVPNDLANTFNPAGDTTIRAPRYVPVSFVKDLVQNEEVRTVTGSGTTIIWRCADYQGLRGDARPKDVLNLNLSATINTLKKILDNANYKSKDVRRHASQLVMFLRIAGATDEAQEYQNKINDAEEIKTEYAFV